MWLLGTGKPTVPADHEARLSAVELELAQFRAWIREHEGDTRDKLRLIEGDISMIAAAVNDLRAETEAERKERFDTVMQAFAQVAADLLEKALELRGEDAR